MRGKPKCVRCGKRAGTLPRDKPLYCSLQCIYNRLLENHMDWEECPSCGQWTDRRYPCPNDRCPSNNPLKPVIDIRLE